MRVIACVLACGLAVTALSQSGPQSRRRNVGNQGFSAVRVSEVNAIFAKYERVMRKVLGLPGSTAPSQSKDQKPATRAQILTGMNHLFEMCKPEFKITPRDAKYDANTLAVPKGNPQRPVLEKLVKWGFIGKVSPIATSKSDNFSLTEFGDAMGFFLMRMADVTHTPSSKWSPYLQGG
jgi:hypothetical protein